MYAGVLVLDVAGGGDAARSDDAAADVDRLLRADGDGGGVVVEHQQRRAGDDLDQRLGGQRAEQGGDVAGGVVDGVGEALPGHRAQGGGARRDVDAAGGAVVHDAGAAAAAAQAVAEGPLQAVLQAIAEGDFDDAGFDENLRTLQVEPLEGGFDALILGGLGVNEQRVVDAVGHDAHGLAEHHGGDALLLAGLHVAIERIGAKHAAARAQASAANAGGAGAAKNAAARVDAGATESAGATECTGVAKGPGGATDGAQPRRDAGGAGERGAAGGAAVDAVEQFGQVVGRAVLHLVDEQLRFGAVHVGAVELLDPVADFVQVGRARGDDHDGVDAVDGHDTHGTEQGAAFAQRVGADGGRGGAIGAGGAGRGRAGCGGGGRRRSRRSARGATRAAAGEQAQRGLDFAGGGVLEREHADGHATQQVDVEGVDDVEPAFGLGTGAAHDQDVAHGVNAHDGVGRDHGPQDGGHFVGAQVLQRDDDGAVARRQGAGAGQARRGDDGAQRLGRADVVGAARVARHDDAIDLQRAFKQVEGFVGADGGARDEGDGAGQRGVHDVVHLEQVTQHDLHHFGGGRILEVESAGGASDGTGAAGWRSEQSVVATNDHRLCRHWRGAGACRPGRRGGNDGRHRQRCSRHGYRGCRYRRRGDIGHGCGFGCGASHELPEQGDQEERAESTGQIHGKKRKRGGRRHARPVVMAAAGSSRTGQAPKRVADGGHEGLHWDSLLAGAGRFGGEPLAAAAPGGEAAPAAEAAARGKTMTRCSAPLPKVTSRSRMPRNVHSPRLSPLRMKRGLPSTSASTPLSVGPRTMPRS